MTRQKLGKKITYAAESWIVLFIKLWQRWWLPVKLIKNFMISSWKSARQVPKLQLALSHSDYTLRSAWRTKGASLGVVICAGRVLLHCFWCGTAQQDEALDSLCTLEELCHCCTWLSRPLPLSCKCNLGQLSGDYPGTTFFFPVIQSCTVCLALSEGGAWFYQCKCIFPRVFSMCSCVRVDISLCPSPASLHRQKT